MIITVSEIIKDDQGVLQDHRINVNYLQYSGSTIEYREKRASLIISLGQDTIILRTHIDNAAGLRSLEKKLVEAINAMYLNK